MLDINFIKEHKDEVIQAVKNKNKNVDVDQLLSLDDKRRKLIQEIQALREERNVLAKSQDRESAQKRGREIKDALKGLESTREEVEKKYNILMESLPNVTHPNMPIGQDESSNVVLRKWGEPSHFDFAVRDHIELGRMLDMIDIETAAHVSGNRFYYLKNAAVMLQWAIIQLVMHSLTNQTIVGDIARQVGNPSNRPFIPVLPPLMMKSQVMKMMDRLDPIDDRYYFEKDDLVLIGSAEHTLGPYYMNRVLAQKDLPIRMIGYSSAFRREAGSYGKDMKGLLRVHHFDKLEMESFSTDEQGEAEQDMLVGIQEYFMQQLEIPYQVVDICSGDTGKPDYRQIDIEAWVPSQKKYRETHSADYMTDFQARRLNIRYKTARGKKKFVYMNDATAFAIGRILIALMENHQQADGSIRVPSALQKYTNFDTIKAS